MKIKVAVFMAGLLFAASGIYANVVLSDTFTGTALGTGWTTGDTLSHNTVSGDSLHLASTSTVNAVRATVRRNTDSSGNTKYGANNKAAYNFYDHALTVSEDIGGVSGTVSGISRISYFLGICYAPVANNMTPFSDEAGVFIGVDLNSTGYRIMTYEKTKAMAAGADAGVQIGYVDVVPTNMTVTFNGNSWALTMSGAKFTQGAFTGKSAASGVYTAIQESDFSTDFYFSTGIRQISTATTPGTMNIGNIEITTSIPEPTTVSLFVISSAGIILFRKSRRMLSK